MNESPIDRESTREDAERFMRLFLANQRRIYGFILSLAPNEADADDLLQETNTVMWRKYSQFAEGTDFAAWGMQIARYEVLKHLSRRARQPMVFDDETARAVADEYAAMSEQTDRRREALASCMGELSLRHRDMIERRYREGGTTRAVAEHFSVTVFTVYKTLNRVHAALLACINERIASEESERTTS